MPSITMESKGKSMEEKIESREIKEESAKGRFIMVLVLYLLGLFM